MRIVITGVTGQDGSLMAEYLYKNTQARIYGVVRQLSVPNHSNLEWMQQHATVERFQLIEGDITDPHSMSGIIERIKPNYFINFAANSFVGTSWGTPAQVFETNTLSVLHQLEAIRKFSPGTRYYQAGSSEEFGNVLYSPQDENHPLRPRSPYGASKASARHLVKVYRESYRLYAVAGWLFNHEGIRRGSQFVTRKITKGIARIHKVLSETKQGDPFKLEPIVLGNLEAQRDWSDAEDFVDGVWKMLNQKEPRDFVLASGSTHTIREFLELALTFAGIPFKDVNPDRLSPAEGGNQLAYTTVSGVPIVEVSPKFYRPAEVDLLLGNPSNACRELGWNPKTSFKGLVQKMVTYDLQR